MKTLILIGIALAPVAVIGTFIWLKDYDDREPLWHVFISFFYGA